VIDFGLPAIWQILSKSSGFSWQIFRRAESKRVDESIHRYLSPTSVKFVRATRKEVIPSLPGAYNELVIAAEILYRDYLDCLVQDATNAFGWRLLWAPPYFPDSVEMSAY
jgi:hypothetical protein